MASVFHHGTPSSTGFGGWRVLTFYLRNFKNLETTKDVAVDLPSFSCFDHEWKLLIYPGGAGEKAEGGNVSLYLHHISDDSIKVDWNVFMRDMDGSTIEQRKCRKNFFDGTQAKGMIEFTTRSKATQRTPLLFELRMRMVDGPSNAYYIPENPFVESVLKLSSDSDTSDATFNVNGSSFCCHRAVLKSCAPMLFHLCEISKGESVHISGIDTEIFRKVLNYIYGHEIKSAELEQNAREFIDCSDRYGLINLKLETEAVHVAKFKFTVDNVVEALLYADSKILRC